MAKMQGFAVKNFRMLKNVTLGKLWNDQKAAPLESMTVVIGKNGAGKSTLFDVFGFLSDCLTRGVEDACDLNGRGGFDRIRSQGQEGPIEFVLYYKESPKSRPITYELSIDVDSTGRPYVKKERLRQRRSGQKAGWPFSFLLLHEGKGVVWKGEESGLDDEGNEELILQAISKGGTALESGEIENVELEDNRKLGIATLGSLKQHPRISAFRRFVEGWYLSYFSPDAARSLPLAGPQRHLDVHGENLANVVQFMKRDHSKTFDTILKRIAQKIPGIDIIDTKITDDNRLLLRFNDKGFSDPFYAQQMSDGTLKLFTYLLLLEDPSPPPFLCVEEPENGLYHKLLEILATEFRTHAKSKNGPQVFITTHQPYFVNALTPDEVWFMEKKDDGFSTIRRVGDNNIVKDLYEQELPLGGLWYSDYIEAK